MSDEKQPSLDLKEHPSRVHTREVDQHFDASAVDFSKVDEKALIRKIDWRLLPVLSLLYLLSFLDRTAIGNARLYDLQKDLDLSDNQYLLCLTIFFFSYSIFEVPSNIFLKRLRPSIWFSLILVAWGICMLVQGLVHDYSGLLTARWFLGMTEAGLFPGVNYYLSCWYKRDEFGLRASLFFSAATVSGAFGGLLAAAIHNMDGVGGKPAWAWIFIIEGLATVVVSLLAYIVLVDFPDTAKFLTEEERALVIHRLQADQQFSAAGEGFRWSSVWQSFTDWKTYVGMGMYMGVDGPLYAFALFTPTIIRSLNSNYSATEANLISVPIYAWACILTVGVGFAADRLKKRAIFNLAFLCVGMAGYIILIASTSPALSYFAIYLAASGIYPLIPNTISWVSGTVEGSYKRGVTLGAVISWGNLNGAVSSNVYRKKDSPHYRLGHGIVLIYIAIGFVSSLIFYFGLKRENAKRERGERDERIGGENPNDGKEWYPTLEDCKIQKGDQWSGYRYVN
ncbi:MFS general substrate transporter [Atractiella rhizophila]|nr:MFS general substrate transporter [Atractiella rhizophila]